MKNAIQRIMAIVLLISLCIPASVLAQAIEQVKFDGFRFDYTPNTTGLAEKVKTEVDALVSKNTPYALVGHSQGGLRALAAATDLQGRKEAAAAYNNLKAVITVSGANKGFKGLENGFPGLSAKVWTDIYTVWGGVRATFGVFELLPSMLPRNLENVTKLLMAFTPDHLLNYVMYALLNKDPDGVAEIRDMMPRSNFIRQNVAETEVSSYKVRTGTTYSWQWRYKWGWFPYAVRVSHPIYTTYTNYEDTPLFPDPDKKGNKLEIGYLVGLNHDTLSMVPSGTVDVRKLARDLQILFGTVEGLHYAKLIGLVGFLTGSIGYAQDARNAKNWMGGINGQIQDLLGSNQGDGFLAKESQFYPGTDTLSRTTHGYTGFNYTHFDMSPFNSSAKGKDVINNKIKDMLASIPVQ